MKNRTWKYHLIGAVLIILGFGTGEAVSGKSDIYADISKYSHFVCQYATKLLLANKA